MSEMLAGRSAAATLNNRAARRIAAVILFATLTAVGGVIEFVIPGTPVPITLQTMFVSLAGVLLGPVLGAASQFAYVTAGALGAPVFAGGALGFGHLMGPTGGYLLAFPLAAAVTGWLAGPIPTRWTVPAAMRLYAAILIGTFVIFAGGAAQLALLTGNSQLAIETGVIPFIIGDLVKVSAAFLVALRYRARTLGWF
jgi:biotin transport system substrate-specific component